MSKAIQIKVPKPCHENWHNMTPKEQGRYCSSCEKIVIDFSVMSDKEVLDHISQAAGQRTCGRFVNDQLNRKITVTKTRRYSWSYVWNLLLATFLFTESYAQEKPQIKKPEVQLPNLSPTIGALAVKGSDTIPAKEIYGTIIDEGTRERIAGATVMVKGTSKGTVTDSQGRFKLMVDNKSAVTLEVNHVNYETKTVEMNNKKNRQHIKVFMTAYVVIIAGEISYTSEDN